MITITNHECRGCHPDESCTCGGTKTITLEQLLEWVRAAEWDKIRKFAGVDKDD